jgi:hypothetical protein
MQLPPFSGRFYHAETGLIKLGRTIAATLAGGMNNLGLSY